MSDQQPKDDRELEVSSAPNDETLQGTVEPAEEHVPKTGLALAVERMDEETWKKWTIACGIVLGLISASCLFLIPPSEGFLPLNAIIALVVALVLPNYAERQLERKAPKGRIAMIIALGVAIVVYTLVIALSGGFHADPLPPPATETAIEAPAVEASEEVAIPEAPEEPAAPAA